MMLGALQSKGSSAIKGPHLFRKGTLLPSVHVVLRKLSAGRGGCIEIKALKGKLQETQRFSIFKVLTHFFLKIRKSSLFSKHVYIRDEPLPSHELL